MPDPAPHSGFLLFYRSRLWALIWSYIFLTYATLPVMRPLLRALKTNVGLESLAILVNASLLLAALGLVLLALRKGVTTTVLALLPLLTIAAIASQLSIAEERMHFLQYGLLGVLVVATGRARTWGLWLAMLVFVAAVGALDELIQWWLPNRVGDWRDVAFNSAAGLLGTALGAVLFWREDRPQAAGSNSTIS
ncbi:VanZ family protein [Halioglobus maricola]|uniref:VanZ family protein n=1 Tax=Halioglobus maricola TaxID=2601894 RepID=A0A5P9NFD2_9GAMM|nr:VanZ family protein [Halioglobus maricola]QFU74493.1 VanZ family protein [Halioglobus maricola]